MNIYQFDRYRETGREGKARLVRIQAFIFSIGVIESLKIITTKLKVCTIFHYYFIK